MEQNPKPIPIEPVDVTKKDRLAWFKSFVQKRPPKKRLAIVAGSSVGVLTLGIAGLALFGPKAAAPDPEPTVESTYVAPPEPVYSPLTGVKTTEEKAKRAVTGVMIENSIDARPQSGLTEAGVVFEAIAEGGITRFLALFQEAQPSNIGPIRSARPYYVRWAKGYDAAYAHSGGSGEALALIQSLGVKDMDHGRYGEQYFSRVSSRYAPHNVYTSMDRLDSLRAANGYNESKFTPFARLHDDPKTKGVDESIVSGGTPTTSISFNISGPLYNTSYSYDASTKTYKRNLAGTPHTDENNSKQIAPTVVVALIMSYSIHSDGIHSVYANIGSGKAIVFQGGQKFEGTWEKTSDSASLVLKGADGKNLALSAGQTWITAIPDAGRITATP
ncbi:DUF3048 domain-containing protein [Candidatus Saccharibacteria bacterium]|nr:DUF3048 domain-containing protein [Candidatus Saccharibacteria bacterium]MCA9328879.1 DUF3048 domain-containing protein [Candidatus Saccharibacteria bacterium]